MPDQAATLPRLEPGSIERTRLLARLAQSRHKTCLLILGPAGSGKTTLALQWRMQALGYGHDVAWMTTMPGDDAAALMDALFTALDRVDPQIAREAHFIFNRDSSLRSPDAMAISLLRGIRQHGRPLSLVIDDCQNAVDSRAHALLQGRFHVTTDDIRAVAKPVLRHRIMTTFAAASQGATPDTVIERLLKTVPVELHERAKKRVAGE